MRRYQVVLSLILGLTPGLALSEQAGPSGAEGPAEAATSTLDEVVVTAEKRQGTASRIGMSITTIGTTELSSAGISDTKDLVKLVPGFTAAQSITNTPIYTLRGIGFNTPNLSSTSPVGVYVNDTAYAYPFMTQQTAYDLQRVEVLKGPQGTLYGRNTTGGLIKFVTALPTEDFKAAVSAGYGNYQSITSQGFISGPLAQTLGARFAYSIENSGEGWQKSVTRDDRLGRKDRKAGRLTLLWKPVDQFTATLRGSFWLDRSDTQAPQAIAYIPETPETALPMANVQPSLIVNGNNSDADWTPADHPGPKAYSPRRPPYEAHSDFESVTLDLQYNLNSSMTLNSSTAFNHVKRHDMTDVNGIPFETLSYEPRGTINSLSQELRLSGADPRLNWTVGGYYSKDRILEGQVAWLDDFSTVQLIRAIGVTLPSAYPLEQIAQGLRLDDAVSRIQTESGSLFANLQPQLTDTLKLTLGARYNIDRTSFRGCLRDVDNNAAPIWNVVITGAIAGIQTNIQPGGCLTFNPTLTALAGEVSDTLRQSNVSWRVGLDQSLSEDALLYGAITRGYKSGGFPIVPANISSQYEPFRQEEVTAYEVGAKLRSLGGSLRTTFAVFYDSYRDKQVFTVIPDPIFRTLERTQNVPKSRIAGAESETTWRIVPSLTAHASLAYINTRVLEYQGYDQGGVAHDFRGDGFPYSPNWQASGGLEHEQGVSSSLSVRSTVSYSYQSSSHGDFLDSALYRIPAYATVDGSVSLAGRNDRWLLSAWARNLLDKNYWTTVSYGRDMYVRYSGMPRTYGMTLTWNID